jgi:hypothetical protein
MTRIILALAVLSITALPAAAQGWTGTQLGMHKFWNGPQGQTVTCTQIGMHTFCN